MKKVLSAVLAGAMVATMAVPALASPASFSPNEVYDSDGEIISNSDDDVYGDVKYDYVKNGGSVSIDGVVPGITMYIPLEKGVNEIISDGTTTGGTTDPEALHYYNEDKETMDGLYDTAEAAEKEANHDAALEAISSDIVEFSTITAADSDDTFYYSETGVTGLTKTIPGGTTDEPENADKYYQESAKTAYDSKLDTEEANDETNILNTAAIKDKEVSGTDAWKNDTVKSYYKSGSFTNFTYSAGTPSEGSYKISLDSLTNEDYFKFDLDKDDGGSMVKKMEVVEDKKLGDLPRTSYLKIDLNDSTTVDDIKSNGTFTFKAKGSSEDFEDASGSKKLTRADVWPDDLEIKMDYSFWINNDKASNDDNPDSGDRVYFDPDDNEDNTLIWGDDRAGLFFEANDDASKFYARLSTKSDSEVYSEYGDPVNADLWFFDFVGSSTIPATSRATLTLGIPWDEDDDYTPNPEDCFIYEKQEDGTLVDVTDKFTYDEDNDGTTEIEGWSIKTRTLGTYVISDTELDLDVVSDDVDEEDVDDTDSTVDTGKEIPNTGSSDMVNVAVVAAAVSLAAAGAVAFKKVTK